MNMHDSRRVDPIEEDLVRRVCGGDLSAFESFCIRLEGPLYGYAHGMVRNVHEAEDIVQETLLRVSEAIVQRQARFFAEGPLAMQPLVMREIADTLGLHESTISRVSSGKYLHTPWGTFELKHFFGSGLASDDGTATSSTAVRTLIAFEGH